MVNNNCFVRNWIKPFVLSLGQIGGVLIENSEMLLSYIPQIPKGVFKRCVQYVEVGKWLAS